MGRTFHYGWRTINTTASHRRGALDEQKQLAATSPIV